MRVKYKQPEFNSTSWITNCTFYLDLVFSTRAPRNLARSILLGVYGKKLNISMHEFSDILQIETKENVRLDSIEFLFSYTNANFIA